MAPYILRRIFWALPVLFAVATITFVLMRLAPGGPWGDSIALSDQARDNVRRAYDLDRPLWEQFGIYWFRLAQGDLGIDVEIEVLEKGAFFDRYGQGDFQVTWLSWFADYADPENWLPQQFGTDGGFNVLGYSNPDVDELFTTAATELNQTERLALYDQAHRLIIEDQAVTPLYYPQRHYLVKPHVAGLVTTVLDAEPGDWFVTSVQIMETEGQPPAAQPDEESGE